MGCKVHGVIERSTTGMTIDIETILGEGLGERSTTDNGAVVEFVTTGKADEGGERASAVG